MKRKAFLLMALIAMLVLALPAAAQEEEGGPDWGILGASFAIGIAAAGGAAGQARAAAAAVSAIARNPGAVGDIRLALILGLAFIESLVIYALIIAMRGAGLF